jgi:hypothetical protein
MLKNQNLISPAQSAVAYSSFLRKSLISWKKCIFLRLFYCLIIDRVFSESNKRGKALGQAGVSSTQHSPPYAYAALKPHATLSQEAKASWTIDESHDSMNLCYSLRLARGGSRSHEKFRLEQDVLPRLADSGALYAYRYDDFWCPIKTAGAPILANQFYLQYYTRSSDTSLQGAYFAASSQTHRTPPDTFHFEGLDLHGAPDLVSALENSSALNDQDLNASAVDGPEIKGPVYIHPSARIHALARIGPNVSIGEDVVIGPGVSISFSLILARTIIQVIASF